MIQFPTTGDWYGCYGQKWDKEIVSASVSHPAKYARNLIRRIHQHLLDQDYLRSGDTILDPFGGVALGATCLRYGVNFIGIELEQKFIDLGQGCDCTGISKADWVRFYSRWNKANYKNGRHWCPECLAEVEKILQPESSGQLSFFGDSKSLSASYIQNSTVIPHTKPHQYLGNIPAKFEQYARSGAQAVLLQGDSRRLLEVLQDKVSVIVTSPPFVNSVGSDDPEKRGGLYRDPKRKNDKNLTGTYGESEGQLGATSGDTFWSTAKLILEQCYQALQPNGPAAFVCKDFVKAGQRVPFSDQWVQLCVAVGFEPVAHFRAWLVKPGPVQTALIGEDIDHTKEHKSFFRRIAEQKGAPPINWEGVVIFRKP